MDRITSSSNPLIKEIKLLKERKHRESNKMFFIEGIRFVEEALKENVAIFKILVSDTLVGMKGGEEILSRIRASNHKICYLPDKLFKEVSDTENPQGILAVIKMKYSQLNEMYTENNFLVILDSIQDPGNIGTIVRTADAAGATGIIISKGCVDLYNPKVLRATMGSIFHVPVYPCESLVEAIMSVKSRGIRVLASHLDGNNNYYELNMINNIAIIIGNEANGIGSEVASYADMLVKIPMTGRAESLNASVAAGILMYEVVRQRVKGSPK